MCYLCSVLLPEIAINGRQSSTSSWPGLSAHAALQSIVSR